MNKNGEWVYLNKESVLFSSSQFLEMPREKNSNLIGGKSMAGEYFKWKTRGYNISGVLESGSGGVS